MKLLAQDILERLLDNARRQEPGTPSATIECIEGGQPIRSPDATKKASAPSAASTSSRSETTPWLLSDRSLSHLGLRRVTVTGEMPGEEIVSNR